MPKLWVCATEGHEVMNATEEVGREGEGGLAWRGCCCVTREAREGRVIGPEGDEGPQGGKKARFWGTARARP